MAVPFKARTNRGVRKPLGIRTKNSILKNEAKMRSGQREVDKQVKEIKKWMKRRELGKMGRRETVI